jgi:hypothetical protein
MSLVLQSSGGGSVTLEEAVTASNLTITVPAVTGTMATVGPAFSAYATANQSIANATFTKVVLNAEDFDTASCFDSTTNYRFTPNVAGYYQLNGWMSGPSSNTQNTFLVIFKNGSVFRIFGTMQNLNATAVINNGAFGGFTMYLNGSTDYIEMYVYQQTGSTQNLGSATSGYNTYLTGAMVRGA